ncbi:MAG: transcriptional repressor [candidate division WS1 bacterium]|jgi:Fe2+ or Zn2+ uptake regulation protein|nr:transcriptional repressor [candidate division WS1 bacterium]
MAGNNGLSEKVHERGGRMTRQCRAVLDALASVDMHPTAAEVYEIVRETVPDISQGTVYRNLRRLVELGYAQELDYGPGASHFDASVESHCHARCTNCSKIIDLDIDSSLAPCLKEAQAAAKGWQISDQRIEFEGLCPECSEVNKSE